MTATIIFDWDPAKAASNLRKHGVRFEEAMLVFVDPLALSLLGDDGSVGEDRWITLGATATGLRLLVHSWTELDADRVAVRIISARRPTRREARRYREDT